MDRTAGVISAPGEPARPIHARLSLFPIFMKVANRHAVVVGNGREALAKVRLLRESCIGIRLISAAPDRELAAFIIQADIEHIAGPYQGALLDDALMVFAATGSAQMDAQIVEDARARAIPANAVDRPDLCDFFTPALVNRAPVAVAIGSEGTGPVLTQLIRARIESMLPASLGNLAKLARSYRTAVDRFLPGGAQRRRFWHEFFGGSVANAVHGGDVASARRHASRLLVGDRAADGYVWLVGAGPGAPDLITLRAQRILQDADIILHDRLVPDTVVAMGRRDARRVCVGKAKGAQSMAQDEINALMIEEARAGRRVVRLKAGDPLVFGRAGEEISALRAANIEFDVVPGVTAALAAAAEVRIPLTLRGVASSLVFATGHDKDMQILPDWAGLALAGTTVAIYMGQTVAARVADRLLEAGMATDTPVAIIEAASRPESRIRAGDLAGLSRLAPGRKTEAPALILIGRALAAADLAAADPLAEGNAAKDLAA